MKDGTRFILRQDKQGMVWDLMLYVPTVTALLGIAANAWLGGNPNLAYLLVFLGSFFLIAGANRILKTRLMLLPSSPVAIEASRHRATLELRNGQRVELLKDIKLYKDFSGRSFGLTGLNSTGQRLQFVFHKGQFALEREFQGLQGIYKPS
ncbi:MAG: hypothetical protein KGI47_00325 [Betaproteobacteria bacterium]|nr:hypothetical protein [Betaproteobacteria bacterium]MDE2622063.1 hypothetical protein [Betaproteobacteria bacterium]